MSVFLPRCMILSNPVVDEIPKVEIRPMSMWDVE